MSDLHRELPAPRFCSPKVALALSIVPGLGQVYLGYPRRGLVQVLAVGSLVMLLSANVLGPFEPVFDLLLFFAVLHNFIDAFRRAVLRSEAVAGFEAAPELEDWSGFSRGTRLATGLLVMGGGGLLLLHTRFGVSFTWVRSWWPAFVILLGIGLFAQAFRESRRPPSHEG